MQPYARLIVLLAIALGSTTDVLAQTESARGLDFRSYLSIRRGMTEGEVFSIAGKPDMQADQGLVMSDQGWTSTGDLTLRAERTELAMRTYTYLPIPDAPYITTITFLGGRVSDVQRDRKF